MKPLTNPAAIESEEAATVAAWALMAERDTPWWRLGRRRFLQRTFREYADLSKVLRETQDEGSK